MRVKEPFCRRELRQPRANVTVVARDCRHLPVRKFRYWQPRFVPEPVDIVDALVKH